MWQKSPECLYKTKLSVVKIAIKFSPCTIIDKQIKIENLFVRSKRNGTSIYDNIVCFRLKHINL